MLHIKSLCRNFYLLLYLILSILMWPFNNSLAQEYSVSTNRPNQTDAISIMAQGFVQLESGIGYLGISNDQFSSDILLIPSIQIRFGLADKNEINLFYDYNNRHFSSDTDDLTFSDHYITVGTKYHFWNENGLIPEAIGVFNIHYTNQDGFPVDWDWEMQFIFQNNLSKKLALAYMLRYRNDLAFTINPSYTISNKWSAFAEYFSDIRVNSVGDSNNGINLGLGYLFSKRVSMDIMYGTIFTKNITTNLLTTGFGWWIK